MGEDKSKTSMKGKDKKKWWAKMDGWNAQEKNGERDETKREKIFYLKAFFFGMKEFNQSSCRIYVT